MQSDAYQFFSTHRCYSQILQAEEARGYPYEWIFRTRTDLIPFQPLPLATLSPDYAYVPMGGFSPDPHAICMNDHLLVCPRHLCRPYFELLELWRSPFCTRDPSVTNRSIFTDTLSDGTIVPAQPPTEPFLLPSLRQPIPQAYFRARYMQNDDLCTASETNSSCCGLMREFPYMYSIVRGNSIAGVVECVYTLEAAWRARDREEQENIEDAMETCRSLSDEYARGLSADHLSELCYGLTGSTPDQPTFDRRVWCFEAAARVNIFAPPPEENRFNPGREICPGGGCPE